MIRFLLYLFVGLFGYHFFKGFFGGDKTQPDVHGIKKESDLDLNKEDIEDAKFKDIDNPD